MSTWFWASYIALWALVVVQALALFALYHHFGQMYLSSPQGREHQGPDLGHALQAEPKTDIHGQPLLLPPAPSILVFTDTECRVCSELKPMIAEFAVDHSNIDVLVVCAAESLALAQSWSGALDESVRVVADVGSSVSARLRIGVTPFMVAVDASGRVCDKGILVGNHDLQRALEMTAQPAPVIVKGD